MKLNKSDPIITGAVDQCHCFPNILWKHTIACVVPCLHPDLGSEFSGNIGTNWCILIPQNMGGVELFQEDQHACMHENSKRCLLALIGGNFHVQDYPLPFLGNIPSLIGTWEEIWAIHPLQVLKNLGYASEKTILFQVWVDTSNPSQYPIKYNACCWNKYSRKCREFCVHNIVLGTGRNDPHLSSIGAEFF